MEKKTIGGFISALRRSAGLTQQEVADALNVSNKTVSKWERDESSPDIGLIPAIAELYGVTCDEILLGERFHAENSGNSGPSKAGKLEKQLKRLAGSAATKFKNMALVSFMLAAAGLIVLFSVSYAFYAPVIGFGLCLVFLAVSMILTATQFNTAGQLLGGEDFDGAGEAILASSRITVFRHFFAVAAVNIFALCLALPFIIIRDRYFTDSVITLESYLSLLPWMIFAALLIVACLFYALRGRLFLAYEDNWLFFPVKNGRKMSLIQCGLLAIPLLIQLCLSAGRSDSFSMFPGGAFLAVLICSFIALVFALKGSDRAERILLAAAGFRNIFCGYLLIAVLGAGYYVHFYNVDGQLVSSDYYINTVVAAGIVWIFLATVAGYLLVKYAVVKNIRRSA